MKALFIVNPAAGHGKATARWQAIVAEVRAGHPATEVWHTRAHGDGATLARQGLAQGFEAILAVGGDGTLSEVIDGFLSAPAADRAHAVAGTWPAGSGCDTARHLGLSPNMGPQKLLAMLKGRRVKRFDAGLVHFTTEEGGSGSRWFMNIAALGLAGSVVREINRRGKPLGGTGTYLVASLLGLLTAKERPIRLVVDGAVEPPAALHTAIIANSSTFGGGMRIADGADLEDGKFDFVTIGGSKWRLLLNFPKIYRGAHFGVEGVSRRHVRRVEASADGDVWLNIDGEGLGKLPAVFEMHPGVLPFLVPS
ncbi:MAG: hypothetical protein HY925_05480 [Elusimicrobia bacterium]|nr:hypothetical protein [Elusimicrobiota bacterium]